MSTASQPKELPLERLASMDERGHKVSLHPADVKGRFKRWRKAFQLVLLVLFLVLPWIRINGHPAVLLDIAQRRFSILGLAFWAHDAPMLIFVAGTVLIGISLATAVWGRIWCGWACPETVFVEVVYRQIERWIEGNAVQRRRLDASPWTGRKLLLRGAKWLAFTAVTLVISHSFLAYFVGIDQLAEMVRHNPAQHPLSFGVMAFISVVLLVFFGWFREQFCIIMCPYGRFQSALLDEHSKMVVYDVARGEPRRHKAAASTKAAVMAQRATSRVELLQIEFEKPEASQLAGQMAGVREFTGDCIDCSRCVQACPTGIDIRRGLQLECINCMACLDACNEVMRNVKKPEGLIRFTSQNELQGKPVNHFRTRVVLLSLVLTGVLSGLVWVLLTRPPVKVTIFNAKNTLYADVNHSQTGSDKDREPELTNQFFVMASNYTFEDGQVRLVAEDPRLEIISPLNPIPVAGGEEKKLGFFVEFPKSVLKLGHGTAVIHLQTRAEDGSWQRELVQEVPLVGPF